MKAGLAAALLAALACAGVHTAGAHPGLKRFKEFCPNRSCFCVPALGKSTVDCATCTCTSCAEPEVGLESDCSGPAITMKPYYLSSSGTCERCQAENCTEEGCASDGSCKKCVWGLGKNLTDPGKPCVKGALPGCALVSPGDASRCAKCDAGLTLNPLGACTKCPTANCAECWTRFPSVCQRCLPGFGLVKSSTNGASVCRQCTDKGCERCDGQEAKCQKCLSVTDPAASQFWVLDPATSQCQPVPF